MISCSRCVALRSLQVKSWFTNLWKPTGGSLSTYLSCSTSPAAIPKSVFPLVSTGSCTASPSTFKSTYGLFYNLYSRYYTFFFPPCPTIQYLLRCYWRPEQEDLDIGILEYKTPCNTGMAKKKCLKTAKTAQILRFQNRIFWAAVFKPQNVRFQNRSKIMRFYAVLRFLKPQRFQSLKKIYTYK